MLVIETLKFLIPWIVTRVSAHNLTIVYIPKFTITKKIDLRVDSSDRTPCTFNSN
jgi:hypothetical protein